MIYDVDLKEVSFNKSIKNSCDLSNIDGIKMYGCEGDIYDLELCSVVPIFFLDWKENEEDIQLSVAYDDEDEKYGCLSKRVNENLIKQNNYLTTSVMVFNDFIKEQGGHLGYDLRY